VFGTAPSGRGFQLSLFGLVSVTVSPVEGFEVNVFSLTFGINPFTHTLKLPVFGRVALPALGWRPAQIAVSLPQPLPRAQVATVEAKIHPWPTSQAAQTASEDMRRAA